jgi:hypothetical protein
MPRLVPRRTPRRAAPRRAPRLAPPGDRYGLLLLLLVVTYVLSAFIDSPLYSALQNLLFIAALALALRTAHVRRRTATVVLAPVLIGSAIAVVLSLGVAGNAGKGVAAIWAGLVLLATVMTIVRRILAHPVITLQSIYGAVSAYLLIGLMFASFYKAIDRLGAVPFFSPGESNTTQTFQYFSFTTLTTLGYGDFTARSDGGRAVAVLEALAGQIFLATLIARLVASFRPSARPRAGTGPVRASRPGVQMSRARDRPQARSGRLPRGRNPGTGHAAKGTGR